MEATMTLAILRYDIFTLPDGDYWFEQEFPGKSLLFFNVANRCAVLIEEKRFERMIATGQAVRRNPSPEEID
jgi:hypothetical protein